MSNFKIFSTGIVAIALSLATGCTPTASNQNTSEAPSAVPVQGTETTSPTASPTTSPTTSPRTSGQNNLSSLDRRFVTEAAQDGLAEVRLGQLASQRGSSNGVKQFGQQMVQDHTQVNNQLKQLAAQKSITLPTTIGRANQLAERRLSALSGAKFDREYINEMLRGHQKDVSAFQNEAQKGQDPDVKAFAAQALPTLQEHLQQVRALANPGSSTSSPTPSSSPVPTSTP
ncbi:MULTISPECIES: DUF4142 domain-containing protein [unclassified Nostoc]|uniref:DUF4142 domain-containing protein n=1 Tax=unclassified Nostoc TaxID=2593658 RepID=UPI002AD5B4BC|nr:DUF4142 domain-containing protein [Nostoc sp. DedQUE03]MDZ7972221.1 DUF4142 domain-containing protein [Nostoc sp. DedQUE03]MDZ8044569.1 DUF4142 domain-containing protein [Nostoc sp. DedQUE02]